MRPREEKLSQSTDLDYTSGFHNLSSGYLKHNIRQTLKDCSYIPDKISVIIEWLNEAYMSSFAVSLIEPERSRKSGLPKLKDWQIHVRRMLLLRLDQYPKEKICSCAWDVI